MLIRRCLLHFPRRINLKANATFLNKTPDPESGEWGALSWEGQRVHYRCYPHPSSLLGALLTLDLSGPRVDKDLSLMLWHMEWNVLTKP